MSTPTLTLTCFSRLPKRCHGPIPSPLPFTDVTTSKSSSWNHGGLPKIPFNTWIPQTHATTVNTGTDGLMLTPGTVLKGTN